MKNFKLFLIIVFASILWGAPIQCVGQNLTTICSETTAKQLKKDGYLVTAQSYEPGYGYWVQYREVLRIEKVAMGSNGGKPWYYFVHYGPESSYRLWAKGVPPPWEIKSEYWIEKETQGWNGMWVRRGTSNIFDVRWKNGVNIVDATVSFTIVGDKWTGHRTTSSDGVICQYYGTLSSDGLAISGNGSCDNGGTFNWSAAVCK